MPMTRIETGRGRPLYSAGFISLAVNLARHAKIAAVRPQAAANMSHRPGTARLPVACISQVAIAGVKPPKSAVARL